MGALYFAQLLRSSVALVISLRDVLQDLGAVYVFRVMLGYAGINSIPLDTAFFTAAGLMQGLVSLLARCAPPGSRPG